jgi:IS6 family transposase
VSDFKWRPFQSEVILWAARWYCGYGISYRDLEQMTAERGTGADHSTFYDGGQIYALEMVSGCAGIDVARSRRAGWSMKLA